MKKYNFLCGAVCLISFTFSNVTGQLFTSVTSLYDYVTTGTYPYVRPESNLNQPTNVSFRFFLVSLQDLDDNAGKFAVTGFFEIIWKDNNLTWDPVLYDNTDSIMVPHSKIWKPYLFHANPYKSIVIVSMSDSRIRVQADGFAYWNPATNLESSCDADVSYFPFDSQTCEMWIIPWQQDSAEININLPNATVDMTYYSLNSQWNYVTSNLYVKRSWNSIHISITFKRLATYFMINVIFPILLLGILNIFVFVLPVDSGERVGFGITLLLSIAVFMTIVADSLPSTATPRLSSVGIFLCVNLILSTLIMVCLIFGLTIYHKDDKTPITRHWIRLVKATKFCFERRKIRNTKVTDHNRNTEQKSTQEELDDQGLTWKDVGRSVDKLFILVFSVLMAVSIFAFAIDIITGMN